MEKSLHKADQTNAKRPMLRLLLATGLVVLLLLGLVRSSRGPVYEGKTIADWFNRAAFFSSRGVSAQAAFEHFDATAQPFLMRWAQRRPPLLAKIHDRWLIQLPNWLQERLPTVHSQQWYLERRLFALQMLGFVEEWERIRPGRNIREPAYVGTNALPVLFEAFSDREPSVRLAAILSLRRLGAQAWPAIPNLMESVSDTDVRVAIGAIQTLGRMGLCATNAVRLLVGIALDPKNPLRKEAIKSLGELGPAAWAAAPALATLLAEDPAQPQSRTTAADSSGVSIARLDIIASYMHQLGGFPWKGDAVSITHPSWMGMELPKSELPLSSLAPLSVKAASGRVFNAQVMPVMARGTIKTVARPPRLRSAKVPPLKLLTVSSIPKADIPDNRALQGLIAETLVKIGGISDEAEPALQRLLASEGPERRSAVAVALWQRSPESLTLQANVISVLSSEDWLCKMRAMRLLGGLGTNAAVFLPGLRRLLEDPQLMVRMSATTAVRRVSLSTP